MKLVLGAISALRSIPEQHLVYEIEAQKSNETLKFAPKAAMKAALASVYIGHIMPRYGLG